jgi:TPR repeat protein
MEFYLLFVVKYIRSFIKFLVFTAILFLAKKIVGMLYKAIRKIFRAINRKIKKTYFNRKLDNKRVKIFSKRSSKKQKNLNIDNKSESDINPAKYSNYFQNGVNFENKGDYKSAIKSYKKSADIGCTDSQHNLAVIYYDIEHVRSYKDSKKWFNAAIEGGVETYVSYFVLGKIYLAEKDLEKSIESFIKSSEIDDSDGRSEYELYDMYRKGLGVVENQHKAIEWLYKSAEIGQVDAQHQLARFYNKSKDYSRAKHWYEQIMKSNHDSYKKDALQEWDMESLGSYPSDPTPSF